MAYVERQSLLAAELPSDLGTVQALWLRGGNPLNDLAPDHATALQRRQDFKASFLQRDLQGLGLRVPAKTTRRFWTMQAHLQGQLLNASNLVQAMDNVSDRHSAPTFNCVGAVPT